VVSLYALALLWFAAGAAWALLVLYLTGQVR
jgi:hypothetical protein